VVGSIVFVAVGSVVATGKAIVGLLPDGIAEGGEVCVLIVFVAVGPVVAKGKVVVVRSIVFVAVGSVVATGKAIAGLLPDGIAEGGEVFVLIVFVAVGPVVAKVKVVVGLLLGRRKRSVWLACFCCSGHSGR